MQVPQVTAHDAKNFGKVWTHKGVAIFMDDTHYEFAATYANIVLKNFVEHAQRAAIEAAKSKQIVVVQE